MSKDKSKSQLKSRYLHLEQHKQQRNMNHQEKLFLEQKKQILQAILGETELQETKENPKKEKYAN